jgi:hypothetical protein
MAVSAPKTISKAAKPVLPSPTAARHTKKTRLTPKDLGWTREQTREVRAKLSAFAPDWDDPSMDVYDEA